MASTLMKGYRIHNADTPDDAASLLVNRVLSETKKKIKENGRAVWAVSGGGSILKFYDALKKNSGFNSSVREQIIVLWVDERHVQHEHESSNFGNAYRYFWHEIGAAELVSVPYQDNPENSVREYRILLEKQGIIDRGVDVMILGMGEDAHTASLFPMDQALESREPIIYANPKITEYPRITLSFPFINRAENLFLYAYGEKKGTILNHAIQDGDLKKYPILNVKRQKLELFSDRAFLTSLTY
jgi:6-phosphogluconolactonase